MDNSLELLIRPAMTLNDAKNAQEFLNTHGVYFAGTPSNDDLAAISDLYHGAKSAENGKIGIALFAVHYFKSEMFKRLRDANGNEYKSAKAAYERVETDTGISYTTATQYSKIGELIYIPYTKYENGANIETVTPFTSDALQDLAAKPVGVLTAFIPVLNYPAYVNALDILEKLHDMTAKQAREYAKTVKDWKDKDENDVKAIINEIIAGKRDIYGKLPVNDAETGKGKIIDIDAVWNAEKGGILDENGAEKADLNAAIVKQGTDLDAVENNLNVQTAKLEKALDVKPEKAGNIRLDGIEIPANHTRLTIENSDLNITLDVDGMDEKAVIAAIKSYFKQLKDAAK